MSKILYYHFINNESHFYTVNKHKTPFPEFYTQGIIEKHEYSNTDDCIKQMKQDIIANIKQITENIVYVHEYNIDINEYDEDYCITFFEQADIKPNTTSYKLSNSKTSLLLLSGTDLLKTNETKEETKEETQTYVPNTKQDDILFGFYNGVIHIFGCFAHAWRFLTDDYFECETIFD